MSISTHFWKRNDTNPIRGILPQPDGTPEDLEGAILRFHMRASGGAVVVDTEATNDQIGDGSDGSKGAWSYHPTSADTATSGRFDAELEVTFPNGDIRTWPTIGYFTVDIGDDLA